ncbi:MAG: creatininase family protein [Phycisphaerae bacterium]|nr:creatininase family protein [Gemmatimonadaceae bacterium]
MKMSRLLATVVAASLAGSTVLAAQEPPTTPPAGRGGRGAGGAPPGPPSMGGGQCSANAFNCPDAVNPLPAPNTVWMEEMTWMDVRDALKAGKTTAIITTGGMEPNGPWLVTGKHNYVLHANCDAIARKLGNALCAPIVKFVPEGNYEPPTSHMMSPGTISLKEGTFRAMLSDIVSSLKVHGFTRIFLIGDSGGNQGGQRYVADSLNKLWGGKTLVAHLEEYYDYAGVSKHMETKGLAGGKSDGLHDDAEITLNMMIDDPKSVRLDERLKTKQAMINGVSLTDKKKNLEWAKEIVAFRTQVTIEAMNKAIANGGTLPRAPRPGRGGSGN